MKYQGKVIEGRNRRVLRIHKGKDDEGKDVVMSLDIVALEFGWIERLRNLPSFNLPEPPRKVVYDQKGLLVKNKETGQLEMVPDMSNAEWQNKIDIASKRFEAVRFFGHLRDDPNIQFDGSPPDGKEDTDEGWCNFADSMWDEIRSSGFTQAELDKVLEIGQELACDVVTDEDIANFSSSPDPDNPEPSEVSSEMPLTSDLSP